MTRGVYSPDVDFEDYVLPRENGGTGVESLAKAASSIGVVSNSNKDVIGGVAGLDLNAKVLASVLPITPDTNFVNVSGNFRLIENFAYTFVITDFDSFKNYEVTCSNGTMTRNGDTLFYTANNNLGAHTFTVNGRVFDFIIQIPGPDTPTITSPVANANVLTPTYTLTGSAFVQFGDASTHLSSDWQISTSPTFGTLAFSTTNDTTNKVSWQVTGLVDTTVYYARLRYRATNNNYSDWSSAITFTIAIPVPVTPTISSPLANAIGVSTGPTLTSSAFTALGDGSVHVNSDWQIATDIRFTNIVRSTTNDAVNRTSWSVTGLSPLTGYFARVRHSSSNGKKSLYSSIVSFTTANVYVFTGTVSASTLNYNVSTRAIAAGWDGILPLIASITVQNGVDIGSNSITASAFDTGTTLPVGSTLNIVNNGRILGKGGNGNGGNGGPALRTLIPTTITNNGTIGGGGGAGGGGGGAYYSMQAGGGKSGPPYTVGGTSAGGGGGGGQGSEGGLGGPTQGSAPYPSTFYSTQQVGSAGTANAAGAGGSGSSGHAFSVSPSTYNLGGSGGGGGTLGVPGGPGQQSPTLAQLGQGGGSLSGYSITVAHTPGGTAGVAVIGNSNITWSVPGTRLGTLT